MTRKIAASYGRTSKEKDDAFSVISQLKGNRQYAQQYDIHLPATYEFAEDYTGTAIDRPGLNKIWRLIRAGQINILIVYQTDRLARKVWVADLLLDELFKHGVELHIVSWGSHVRDTPDDRTRFNFESTFGDRERRLIIERTSRGRTEKLANGIWHAGPHDKYGFQHFGRKRESRLEIVEGEAEIVCDVFDKLVWKGWGVTTIYRDLNAKGVPTRAAAKGIKHLRGSGWNKDDIYAMLRDEAYIGVFYARKFKCEGGKCKRLPKEQWYRMEFPHLRIVDEETFTAAQRILNEGRRKNAPVPTNKYLMGRRITCACRYAIAAYTVTSRGKRFSYYYCKQRKNGLRCDIPNVRADLLDRKIWERLMRFLRDPQDQYETLKQAQVDLAELHADAIANIESIEQVRARYERELTERYDDYREGLITKAMYVKYKEELDEQLRAALEACEEYRQHVEPNLLTDEDIDATMRDLQDVREELDRLGDLPFEKRRTLIERMNITGKMRIKDGSHVLVISVYTRKLDEVLLEELVLSRRRTS